MPQVAKPVSGAAPVLVKADPNAPAAAPVVTPWTNGNGGPAGVMYGGHTLPFTFKEGQNDPREAVTPGPNGQVGVYIDAAGDPVERQFVAEWQANGSPTGHEGPLGKPSSAAAGGAGGAVGTNEVQGKDVKDAVDTYRATAKEALDKYLNPGKVTPPTPQSLIKPIATEGVSPFLIANPERITSERVAAPLPVTAAQATAAGPIQTTDARATGPVTPALVTPAERLAATRQATTTVQDTGLDTAQSDQARALVARNLQDLEDTAQGRGAGQLAAALRAKLDAARLGQTLQGNARGARGSERKGALITGQLAGAEQGANALIAREEQASRERQAAQGQYGAAAQATRSTDVDVAAKSAELQKSRNELQAQLDAARTAGDATREQEIKTKLAELDQQAKALNAGATNAANESFAGRDTAVSLANAGAKNTAAEGAAGRATTVSVGNAAQTNTVNTGNEDRKVTVGTTNATLGNDINKTNVANRTDVAKTNTANNLIAEQGNADRSLAAQTTTNAQALAAQKQQEDQRIAQEDLKIRLGEAAQKAAQGLLDEAQREELIKEAREKLAISQAELTEVIRSHKSEEERAAKQQEVNGWLALLQSATSIGTSIATKTSDPRAKEDIRKLTAADLNELANALERSGSTFKYKPGMGPEGLQAGGMADALKATKLGPAVVKRQADGLDGVDYVTLNTLMELRDLKKRKGVA